MLTLLVLVVSTAALAQGQDVSSNNSSPAIDSQHAGTIGGGSAIVSFTTIDGVRYNQANITVCDIGISVLTSDGGTTIPFDNLPKNLAGFPVSIQQRIRTAMQEQKREQESATSAAPSAIVPVVPPSESTATNTNAPASTAASPSGNDQVADAILDNLIANQQLTKEQAVRIAIACATRALPIFEKRYTVDKRARQAIGAAQGWLDNPSIQTKNMAGGTGSEAFAAYREYAEANAAAHPGDPNASNDTTGQPALDDDASSALFSAAAAAQSAATAGDAIERDKSRAANVAAFVKAGDMAGAEKVGNDQGSITLSKAFTDECFNSVRGALKAALNTASDDSQRASLNKEFADMIRSIDGGGSAPLTAMAPASVGVPAATTIPTTLPGHISVTATLQPGIFDLTREHDAKVQVEQIIAGTVLIPVAIRGDCYVVPIRARKTVSTLVSASFNGVGFNSNAHFEDKTTEIRGTGLIPIAQTTILDSSLPASTPSVSTTGFGGRPQSPAPNANIGTASASNLTKDEQAELDSLIKSYGQYWKIVIKRKLSAKDFPGLATDQTEAYEVMVKGLSETQYRRRDPATGLPAEQPGLNIGIAMRNSMSQPAQAILLTTQTSFQSSGNAEVLAKKSDPVDVTMDDGFAQKVPVLLEVPPDPKRENRIQDLLDKARQK
jgi:hypothetical protein